MAVRFLTSARALVVLPQRSSSPPPIRPSSSRSPLPFGYSSQTPPRCSKTPPISQVPAATTESTLFSPPPLVDIEGIEESEAHTSAAVESSFDLDEDPVIHILRVSTHRTHRQANPPAHRRSVYSCYPCARTFPSYGQGRAHKADVAHRRSVAAAAYPTARLTCHVCDRRFGNAPNAEQHYSGTMHHRAITKVRRTCRSD